MPSDWRPIGMNKKKKDPMLDELPAVAADYIKLIIRKRLTAAKTRNKDSRSHGR